MPDNLTLGIKSDPIETRYSFDWLFGIAADENIPYIQLGTFFELYVLDDRYFISLRELAARKNIRIKSLFTAHRELGGFFYEDPSMEKAARKGFERLIHVAGLLGADFCGSNPGAVYRDRMETKESGIRKYLFHMQELMHLAFEKGLRGLTMEPMSSLAEPPTTPEEMDRMIGTLREYHQANSRNTVPVYLCGDISHGLADVNREICFDHMELFSHGIPYMAEFHIKNTDPVYNSTFGFSPEEINKGVVDLQQVRKLIENNRDRFPVKDLTGYLEIGGPKTGRDYSDPLLEKSIRESLRAIKQVFS
jgi:sugar phosphate isomerase/epimerase